MKQIGVLKKQPTWRMRVSEIGKPLTGYYPNVREDDPSDCSWAAKRVHKCERIDFVEVPVFDGVLSINDYWRGRSAAVFSFIDVDGHAYEVCMKGMFLLSKQMKYGDLHGPFTFRKTGANVYLWPLSSSVKWDRLPEE